MIDLIDIEDAKLQVHLTNATDDPALDMDIALKVMAASAIVLNYMKVVSASPQTYPWPGTTTASVPYDVKAAALLVFAELFVAREASDANVLSPTIKHLLWRWSDKPLA